MIVESLSHIQSAIIDWYAKEARILPWRIAANSNERPDPYRIWLSEVMLQQTTVTAVMPYFERFTARWPTILALAAADPEDILSAWAGLGYYSRARNLIACAQMIVDSYAGQFPSDREALRALPGIGDYTAAAIGAIAFGKGCIPIDANIERVITRLFAIQQPLSTAKAAIREAAVQLWPTNNGGDFAQALMDLGAGPCSARAARCGDCPIARWCMAHHHGIADGLPIKPAKKPKPERYGRAWWIEAERDGVASVWLVRRPPRGLLGGMRALPGPEWSDAPATPAPNERKMGAIRHVFTHFALTLTLVYSNDVTLAVGEGAWWPICELDEAGLPTLYRRAGALVNA